MNLKWNGSWLSMDCSDVDEVRARLEDELSFIIDEDYRVYYPGWNSIVTGKQRISTGRAMFLFCGDKGKEVMARMVLE